jgi:hypothetical protein
MEDTNPKTQHGLLKPQLHLVPSTAVEAAAGAFELGAKKYGAYNWRERTVSTGTYVAAAKRHIDAYFEGQENDPESGKPHLGHAIACMAILIDAAKFGNLIDDRPKVGVHRQGQLFELEEPYVGKLDFGPGYDPHYGAR